MFKLSKVAGSVIAVAAIFGGAGTALADGYKSKGKVSYDRPTNWSGFYFGVGSGYSWSNIDLAHVPDVIFPTGISTSSDHDDAFVSVHAGVQHQFGAVVLGVEGGWMSTLRGDDGSAGFCDSVVPVLANPILAPGNFCSARLQDILTIGGRLGWAAGHWMPYLAGGYANAAYEFNNRVAGTVRETAHERLDGWYLGGGVEWAVSPGWTVGLEYRHYEFEDGIAPAHRPDGSFLENVRFDATTDTVSARVSWRWGRPEPKPLK